MRIRKRVKIIVVGAKTFNHGGHGGSWGKARRSGFSREDTNEGP